MARWLRLKDIHLGDEQRPPTDVVLNISMSPYDVPDAVRGMRTDDNKLRIEFRYIDGEETVKSRKYNQHLVVFEGEHSGRLMAMEVDMDSACARTCSLKIEAYLPNIIGELSDDLESAWNRITTDKTTAKNEMRAKFAAKRAFETRKDDLLNQLCKAD